MAALTACGLLDAGEDALPTRLRWVLVDTLDDFILVRFDDPRRPEAQVYPALQRCCSWTPDGKTFLARAESPDVPLLGTTPEWSLSPLPAPEAYDRTYFIDATRFLAHVSPAPGTSEWLVRDIDGNSVARFGQDATLLTQSGSGAIAFLENEVLTLVRPGFATTTLATPALAPERIQLRYDDTGTSVLIATWAEDTINLSPLPDFVAHVETSVAGGCQAGEAACHPMVMDAAPLAGTDFLVARADTATEGVLFIAPLQRTVTLVPETHSEGVIAAWQLENGDGWFDGPTGRARRVVGGPGEGVWAVEERNVRDAASDWRRIAEGEAATVEPLHVDFDLLWLRSGDDLGALDLSRGGEPNWLGPTADWIPGPRRLSLLFEADSPVLPCGEPCRYVAYLDPSDAAAPVLRGNMDALGLSGFAWTPDESGLLLLSEGSLFYHAFAARDERLPLARVSREAIIRVPPAWW